MDKVACVHPLGNQASHRLFVVETPTSRQSLCFPAVSLSSTATMAFFVLSSCRFWELYATAIALWICVYKIE